MNEKRPRYNPAGLAALLSLIALAKPVLELAWHARMALRDPEAPRPIQK